MSEPKNILGPWIKTRRAALSRSELARRLKHYGVELSPSQIARIETRRRPLFVAELQAIVATLGVSSEELAQAFESTCAPHPENTDAR